MNIKKNRRTMKIKSFLKPKESTDGELMAFVKLPLVRYVAGTVAAYNLVRMAFKSAANIIATDKAKA